MVEEIAARVERLRAELERERDHYLRLGRTNQYAMFALMMLTVGGSLAAGILGLGLEADPKLVGLVGLVPAVAATAANQFKLQGKADWHYRKYDALKALLRRANYDLPLKASSEDVAEIGQALSKIEAEMSAAWEQSLTFKFENRDA